MRRFLGCGNLTEMLTLQDQLTKEQGCNKLELIESSNLDNEELHQVPGNPFGFDVPFVLVWNDYIESKPSVSEPYLRYMVGYVAGFLRATRRAS